MDAPEVISTQTGKLRDRFHQFFFAQEVPYGLAIVRMLIPMVLLGTVCTRWPFARELFSADGAPAPLADLFRYYDYLPVLPGTVAVGLFTALAFFLFCSSIGWMTRFSLVASLILYTYFCCMDCISMATKYSAISTHVLFILSLSHCGSVWSVDSWLKGKRAARNWPQYAKLDPPRFEVWPQRLMQILIALVYFGAAITKLHTPGYLEGDQIIYWAMSRYNNPHPLGEYLTLYPIIVSVMSYVAIVWEMVFIFVVWRKWGRPIALALGASFHIGTLFSLGLYIFPRRVDRSHIHIDTISDVLSNGVKSDVRPAPPAVPVSDNPSSPLLAIRLACAESTALPMTRFSELASRLIPLRVLPVITFWVQLPETARRSVGSLTCSVVRIPLAVFPVIVF